MDRLFKNDISFKDLISYLLQSWKVILVSSILGLSCGYVLYVLTPKQYEAVAQIQMASVGSSDPGKLSIVIEDPILLLARLSLPSTYSLKELRACGFHGGNERVESILGVVKPTLVKGLNNIVQLKVQTQSKDFSISCVQAIFENIKLSQEKIISPIIDEAKILRSHYRNQLKELELIVERADKSGTSSSTAYLANSDQMKLLNMEIFNLDKFINFAGNRQAKLVSPIYSSGVPTLPNKKVILIGGLFLGVILGCLLILFKEIWMVLKKS